jgi:hypothetical protein
MRERTAMEHGLFDILKDIIDGEWGPYDDEHYWGLVDQELPRLFPPQQSCEQRARDILDRMEVEGAQSYSSGEIVELANLINDNSRLKRHVRYLELVITEELSCLTGDQQAEMDQLRPIFEGA